jgi:hypothetical protein
MSFYVYSASTPAIDVILLHWRAVLGHWPNGPRLFVRQWIYRQTSLGQDTCRALGK